MNKNKLLNLKIFSFIYITTKITINKLVSTTCYTFFFCTLYKFTFFFVSTFLHFVAFFLFQAFLVHTPTQTHNQVTDQYFG